MSKMGTFDLEDEIFKHVDMDPKDSVPFLLDMIRDRVNSTDSQARNMLIYSQQAVIRSLHHKIGTLLEMKRDERESFIDIGNMNEKVEIPVKQLVQLEETLQDVAENSMQPLNVNPLIVLQPGHFDPSQGYPALEPSTMQQLLILAPTRATPVTKGPLQLKNPQISVACPVNSDIDSQNSNLETRSAGLDEKDVEMIARKYMIPIPASNESSKLEELEAFAKDFRARRIRLGYTQNDVGLSLGKIYSSDFSQTTLSRFEALNLSFKNMISLKPFMEKWINDAERHKTLVEQDASNLSMEDQKTMDIFMNSSDNVGHRKRKRRTTIDVRTRKALEQYYLDKPHPSNEEICAIAEALNQERNTVRYWFSNRRQRERRMSSFGQAFPPPHSEDQPDSHQSEDSVTSSHNHQSAASVAMLNNSSSNVLLHSDNSAFSTPRQNSSVGANRNSFIKTNP